MTPACGWDQAVFRCGRCGIEHTATTEDGLPQGRRCSQ
ncbi:hypothetical protein [Streptomyces capoamus]|nr:hypothetical protein [Streptomyces capoamus]